MIFFLNSNDPSLPAPAGNDACSYGFRINYNFNTHQQREVEIISVADHIRYAQINKGDILLQINGLNVDSISERDLTRFVQMSSSPKAKEFEIKCLTVYRPFVGGSGLAGVGVSEPQLSGSVENVQERRQPNGMPISSSTPVRGGGMAKCQTHEFNSETTTTAGDGKSLFNLDLIEKVLSMEIHLPIFGF